MKNKKEIPSRYKCSRCKRDLRIQLNIKNKCICNKNHPISTNKTGKGIWIAHKDYDGIRTNPFFPIDF